MKSNNSNTLLNILPYVFVVAIVIVLIMAFIPSSPSNVDIAFKDKEIRIKKDESIQLTLLSSGKGVKYKSSNDNIVKVNERTGYITGVNKGTATITAYNDSKSDECFVEVYESTYVINIEKIELSETSMNLYVGDNKNLSVTISPSNATNKKIIWSTSNSNVASIDKDGNVKGVGIGSATIKARSENGKYAICNVVVTNKSTKPTTPTKPQIEKLVISSNKLSLKVAETKKISYHIEPENGEIKSISFTSSNPSIATVDNSGNVKGIKEGTVEVTINVNNSLIGKVTVTVNKKITGLNLKSSENVTLKVGGTSQISAETVPSNSGVKITYQSNNSSIATVSNSGLIKGIKSGSAVITLTADTYTKRVNVTVQTSTPTTPDPPPTVEVSGVWGYSDSRTVSPIRADLSFFTGLANKGIGTISGNVYHYSNYTYDISKSNLTVNGRTSLIRIYYPKGVDLSNVNTLAFLGGTGERNMSGMFSSIDRNTSMIKSGGIIILVSTTGSYHYQDAINATNFVKAITKQKSGKKNSVAGYSLGGPAAGNAMVNGNYDRLFILHAKVELPATAKLKNKTIYVYSPKGDKLSSSTRTTLVSFKNDGAGKNLTLVTNNSEFIKTFGNVFTIVNPGSAQGSGHGYANFVNGNVFAFACKD